MTTTLNIMKYLFSGLGLVFLLTAAFFYSDTGTFLSGAVAARGTVVDLDQSRTGGSVPYRPVVAFETGDGRAVRFVSAVGSNPPGYTRGEHVQVLYSPTQPEIARIDGFFSLWGLALIFGGIGAVFFVTGGGMVLQGRLGKRRREYLRRAGVPVKTRFQHVVEIGRVRVNHRHPFRVVTHWKDPVTSRIHVFESENLWFNRGDRIPEDDITVYIAPNDPKTCWMNLSLLPETAAR